jgi:hypothetical protein
MTNWREYGEEERACQSEYRHYLMGGWIADMSKEGRRLPPAGLASHSPCNSNLHPGPGDHLARASFCPDNPAQPALTPPSMIRYSVLDNSLKFLHSLLNRQQTQQGSAHFSPC